jgi:hypothetical protein
LQQAVLTYRKAPPWQAGFSICPSILPNQGENFVAGTKWFYCTAEVYRARLEDVLNEWGSRGWELVTLTVIPIAEEYQYRGPDLFLAVFKKPEETPEEGEERIENERFKRRARGRLSS